MTCVVPILACVREAGKALASAIGRAFVMAVLTATLAASVCLAQAKKEPPWFGVATIAITPAGNEHWTNLPRRMQLIVFPSGSAFRAGMKSGDILVSIGGLDVSSDMAMPDLLARYEVGQTVEVVVMRAGVKYKAQIALELPGVARRGHGPNPEAGRGRRCRCLYRDEPATDEQPCRGRHVVSQSGRARACHSPE